MKKVLRKRSLFGILILFIASVLAFASFTVVLFQQTEEPSLPVPDSLVQPRPSSPDSIYQELLTTINDLYARKAYTECLAALKKAQAIKPGVSSIQERIIRVEGLIAQQQKDDREYQRLTDLADGYFTDKKYQDAKSTYQMAIDVSPDKPYARERLTETMGLLRAQKASNILYDVAVANADKLFAANDYDKAKQEYENAASILPGERYPKDRINAILKIQLDEKVRNELYANAIAEGDRLFTVRNYRRSLQEYRTALAQKPGESYPQQRIDELTRIIRELEEMEEAYRQAIASADQLFTEKRYPDAREGYEGALRIKENEPYPLNRIREIDGILAEINRIETTYAHYLTLADSLYISKEFPNARQYYLLALKVKPGQAYPMAMIEKTSAGVETLMAGELAAREASKLDSLAAVDSINQEIARQAGIDESYRLTIVSADRQLQAKQYDSARITYLAAGELRPEKPYWQEKVGEIDRILLLLADQAEQDARYSSLIAEGDSLLALKSWALARTTYQRALDLKPQEPYPQTKQAEIDSILADISQFERLTQQYEAAVEEGNRLFTAQSWDQAKVSYTQALTLKPEESYPKVRMAAIDSIKQEIARQAGIDESYRLTIVSADRQLQARQYDSARVMYLAAGELRPEKPYWQEKVEEIDRILLLLADQAARDARYASLIAEGDRLQGEKEYTAALKFFTDAGTLKPDETYPPQKITELQALLSEIERLAALERSYTRAVTEGDSLLALKSWSLARTTYQRALDLKPQEPYPQAKQAEIDSILAEISQSERLTQQFQAAVEEGNRLFAAQSWDQAKVSYTQALTLKPDESYPKLRMAAIDSIQQEIARQAGIDESYRLTIVSADRQLQAKQYDSARVTYLAAGELRPEKPYWQEKVGEIDKILALLADQAARDARYASLIAEGDRLQGEKEYTAALKFFTDAGALKPDETYPPQKMAELQALISEIERLAQQFQAAIEEGNRLFAAQSWDQAKVSYTQALTLKPDESYPKVRMAAIDSIKQEITRQAGIDESYRLTIVKADRQLQAKQYDSARVTYLAAGELRPEKPYWQEKVGEIDRILAAIRKRDADYLAGIRSADSLFTLEAWEPARAAYETASAKKEQEAYPKERIREINRIVAELEGKRNTFDRLVANGDSYLFLKEFTKATDTYQQALDLFPEETYPKSQMRRITVMVDSIYRANKSDYDKAVGEGDRFFNSFEFDKAIDAFTRAMNLLPMETYPQEMILKIRSTIAENAIADVLNTPVVIKGGNEQKFSFNPVNVATRRDNFIYIKVRNLSGEPFNVLLRYGKDGQMNGGLAIRNISTDGEVNERLISVKSQDLWYREDNNWISLYPQGGDIEVSFIQVSRAIQ